MGVLPKVLALEPCCLLWVPDVPSPDWPSSAVGKTVGAILFLLSLVRVLLAS